MASNGKQESTGAAAELDDNPVARKRIERRVFILLTVFLAPAISIAVVGGYGFVIWISQLILGPPVS